MGITRADTALTITHYHLGDFQTSGQFAKQGLEFWRSGGAQSAPEEVDVPAGACLCFDALLKWHSGEIAAAQATIEEAISQAKELNDMHGLAVALLLAAVLAQEQGNPAEVDRLASNLIELSTRENFAQWRAIGVILRGCARSVFDNTTEGIACDRAGNKRSSGDRYGAGPAILLGTKG